MNTTQLGEVDSLRLQNLILKRQLIERRREDLLRGLEMQLKQTEEASHEILVRYGFNADGQDSVKYNEETKRYQIVHGEEESEVPL